MELGLDLPFDGILRSFVASRSSTPKRPAVRFAMKLCRLSMTAVSIERFMTICCSTTGFIIAQVVSTDVRLWARKAI